jgi:hypothetical protein
VTSAEAREQLAAFAPKTKSATALEDREGKERVRAANESKIDFQLSAKG